MLRHFFDDFMTFVPLQLPQLLDITTMESPQFFGDYACSRSLSATPTIWKRSWMRLRMT